MRQIAIGFSLGLAAGCLAGALIGAAVAPVAPPALAAGVRWYAILHVACVGGFAGAVSGRRRAAGTAWRPALAAPWSWIALWHAIVAGFCAAGALLGAFLFVAVGGIAGVAAEPARLLVMGLRDGGFYALIWAPGIAFVLCCMRARQLALRNPAGAAIRRPEG
jgi:hypothetical protein